MKPEDQRPSSDKPGRDNWFVDMFDDFNSATWNRKPGDKLTLRQKTDIVGQIVMMILIAAIVVSAIIGLMVLYVMYINKRSR
jgi:hypothetical protein